MLEKPILESFIYIVKILKVSYYSCSSILASLWKSGVQTWEYLAHSSNFSAGWKSLSYILNVFLHGRPALALSYLPLKESVGLISIKLSSPVFPVNLCILRHSRSQAVLIRSGLIYSEPGVLCLARTAPLHSRSPFGKPNGWLTRQDALLHPLTAHWRITTASREEGSASTLLANSLRPTVNRHCTQVSTCYVHWTNSRR